jgi:hypothetical protein
MVTENPHQSVVIPRDIELADVDPTTDAEMFASGNESVLWSDRGWTERWRAPRP